MIIQKIAVGNKTEAYIEGNLHDQLNIISSDDNNKGKTIIIQSLMYCLGNTPVFPSSFDYKKYKYIIEFKHNGINYILCRENNNFILKNNDSIFLFDNVSEMKRYWSKNISELPQIIKDEKVRIVDPELYTQIFFVGQDKKDSSNIANKAFYSKLDFYNMIYAYKGIGEKGMNSEEISLAKGNLKKLGEEKKALLKQHKILNSKKLSANYFSPYSDRVAFKEKIEKLEKVKDKIGDLRTSRNSIINRKMKYEITLKELMSLNRTIATGELKCLNCDSTHIGYVSANSTSYTFDVSTSEVRNQIINSINEKIGSYSEELDKLTVEINYYQTQVQEMLVDDAISLESIVLYKQEMMGSLGIDEKIEILEGEIVAISDSLKANYNSSEDISKQQNKLISKIIDEMNLAYKEIDPIGTLTFDNIFTKKSEIFSGSEATEFHLVKMYGLAKVLEHSYPIIIDSFRAEDLSTDREQVVIDLFTKLPNQVIFTTTLKREEIGKYNDFKNINHIDYSDHHSSKLLSEKYSTEFANLASLLMIDL